MALFLILVLVCSSVLAIPTPEDGYQEYLYKQKAVLSLFKHINQPSRYKSHIKIAGTYNPEENLDDFENPAFVKGFFSFYHNEHLDKNEIFSIFNNAHLPQAIALFNMFYHAKNFDVFFKTAVWARQNVNQGMFVYSASVAVTHRPDTEAVILPPIYEIYPNYFFNAEVIYKAQEYRQMYFIDENKNSHKTAYIIPVNYTGSYVNIHPEQSLSYYLEDVGINAFYWYYNIYYPFWMNTKEYGLNHNDRGEQYYFMHQQLLARFFLERLANHNGEIPYFNWDLPIETGYYPALQYPNGLEFPQRPNFAKLQEYFYDYGQTWAYKSAFDGYGFGFIKDFERRFIDAVHSGYVLKSNGENYPIYNKEGLNILGNLIQGNGDCVHPRYYGGFDQTEHRYYSSYEHFSRHVLGYSPQPLDYHRAAPSALEHYETSLRDPVFYQWYKRIILNFQYYKYFGKANTAKALRFDDFNITNVEMDSLVTYFEDFDSDISNAVFAKGTLKPYDEAEDKKFIVYARQKRLTHKHFSFKITVKSEVDANVSVRVFIGPKHDKFGREFYLNENRVNMVQLDHFVHSLSVGENVIERHSEDNHYFQSDHTRYRDLWERVSRALEGKEEFEVGGKNGREYYFKYPKRYVLPKGSEAGTEHQFYFIISPHIPYPHEQPDHRYFYRIDGYSLGYPFDHHVIDQDFYASPNIYPYSAWIYHKTEDDVKSSSEAINEEVSNVI